MALPAPPDFNDGIVTASKLQQLSDAIDARTPLVAYKTANQDLPVSSTAFTNITQLVLSIEANSTYDGWMLVGAKLSAGTTEDIHYDFVIPADATMDVGHMALSPSVTSFSGVLDMLYVANALSGAVTFGAGLNTLGTHTVRWFTLRTGGTAGTIQVRAGQDTSGVNTTTVLSGSKLCMTRTV